MREKGVNATRLQMMPNELVLFPLKGASYEHKGSPGLSDEKYSSFDHFLSHIIGLNELPSIFSRR